MRRTVALTLALVATLALTAWSVRSDWQRVETTFRVGQPDTLVSAGAWQDIVPRADEPAERIRVVSLTRARELTPIDEGDDVESLTAPGEFAVVIVECECPDTERFRNPVTGLVDDRGRVWEELSLYGDYEQADGAVRDGDIEDEASGPLRYVIYFPVTPDARGLVVTAEDRSGELIKRVGWTGAEQ